MDKLVSLNDILFNLFEKDYKMVITPKTESINNEFFEKYVNNISDFNESSKRHDEVCNLTWAHLEDGFRTGFKTALNLIFDNSN